MRLNKIQSSCLFKGTFSKVSRGSNQHPTCPIGGPHALFSSPFLFSLWDVPHLPFVGRPTSLPHQGFGHLLLALCCCQTSGTSTNWDVQHPWRGEELGCPRMQGVWDAKERREMEKKRGCGDLQRWHGAASLDALEILGEVPLNRHED